MKRFVQGQERSQGTLFPACLDEYVSDDNPVRVIDVFVEEPATSNPLFGLPNVVCTPHLGAATTEAQENVALQIAEQISDFLSSSRPMVWLKARGCSLPSRGRRPATRSSIRWSTRSLAKPGSKCSSKSFSRARN